MLCLLPVGILNPVKLNLSYCIYFFYSHAKVAISPLVATLGLDNLVYHLSHGSHFVMDSECRPLTVGLCQHQRKPGLVNLPQILSFFPPFNLFML